MTPKRILYALGALILAALLGYGFGRYATPAKVVTVTKVETKTDVQWKDRIVEKTVQGPVRTVTHTVERLVPCTPGTETPVKDTTVTVEAGPVIIDRVDDGSGVLTASTKTEITKTVTADQPRLMLQAGAIAGLDLRPTYDVGASYRFAGPLWLGAAYHTDKRLELRASFTF